RTTDQGASSPDARVTVSSWRVSVGDVQAVRVSASRSAAPASVRVMLPHLLAPASPTTRRDASRSEEHTSELQSRENLVCRLLLPPPARSTRFPYTTLFRSGAPPTRARPAPMPE